MTSRIPASSCSWAWPRSPPMMIAAGLKKFTLAGQHLPDRPPGLTDDAGRHAGRRPRPGATTSRLLAASPPASRQLAARAPGRPRRPRGSPRCRSGRGRSLVAGARGCGRCRPAAPCGAAVDAPAGDDAAADPGADLDEQQVVGRRASSDQCSPRAMMLTSLSTSTGRVVAARRTSSGIEKPSQPGMIGGLTGCPVAKLDGPGHPDPDAPHVPRRRGRPRASSSAKRSSTQSSTGSGPAAMSRSQRALGERRRRRGRSTARREWVAPRSAASTTPASWLKARTVGGRPPVDALPPAS